MTPETLKRIEWAGCDREGNGYCVVCGEPASSDEHAPDCQLKADLDASSGERPEIQVGDWVNFEPDDVVPEMVSGIGTCKGNVTIETLGGGYHVASDAKEIRQANGRVWRRGGATS